LFFQSCDMHNTNKKHFTVKRNGEEQGKKEVGTKKKKNLQFVD